MMYPLCLVVALCCIWNQVLAGQLRPGEPTQTHSCNHVRGVPEELFRLGKEVLRPDGLDRNFYKKYTEAYGIPILGSHTVSDDALKRACYTVRFMLADHSGVRQAFYKLGGRVAVMAKTEQTLDIPEHSHMDPYMNQRARGLGGTVDSPVTTGAEENVLCLNNDRYHPEDIMLHEFAHAVDIIGATTAIANWYHDKEAAYTHANTTRQLLNIYSGTNNFEYFAEGAQTYFEVNIGDTQNVPNAIINDIDTRAQLRNYDRRLYDLLHKLFPCGNTYLKRCESTREKENNQHLRMNCNTQDKVFAYHNNAACPDYSPTNCIGGASSGECEKNPGWMLPHCKTSCHSCGNTAHSDCPDKNQNCADWARNGECQKNPNYMLPNCQHSCNSCQHHIG